MNPLAILKGARIFLIIGAVIFLTSFLKTCEENRVAERDAAITANAEKVTAQANAAVLATANAQLEAIAATATEALIASTAATKKSNENFAQFAEVQQKQKALLEGDRLNRAIRGKRELVERLMNRATRARFDEVEEIFDGT